MKIYIVYNSAKLDARNIVVITSDKQMAIEMVEKNIDYMVQSKVVTA